MAASTKKQPRKPSRKTAPKQAGLTSAQKAFRDLIALEMLADGASYAQVSAIDGRSQSALKSLREKYLRASGSAVPDLLRQDPVRIVEDMLRRKQVAWRLFAQVAMTTDHPSSRIGAIKGMIAADERTVELLQHVGKLPKELGTLRHVIDVREIAERMFDTLDRLDRGELTAAEVRAEFEDAAGLAPIDSTAEEA